MPRWIPIALALLPACAAPAVAQPLEGAPASAVREPDAIAIVDGRVSIPGRQPLALVLDAVGAATGVPIELDPALSDALCCVATIREAPIDQALWTLLAGYDVFTLFEAGDGHIHRARALWVLPRGAGRLQRPRSDADWASAPQLLAHLEDSEAPVRAAALMALAERGGRLAAEAIQRALADPDEQVRARALDLAYEHSVPLEAVQLRMLALGDQSAAIRLQALLALEPLPDAAAVAAAARMDPDPLVRTEAAALLERIGEREAGP